MAYTQAKMVHWEEGELEKSAEEKRTKNVKEEYFLLNTRRMLFLGVR